MPGITDVGAEAANTSRDEQSTDEEEFEWDRFDVSGLPFAKQHPTTAVGGTAVALRYFPDFSEDGDPDRGYIGLVLDDPFAVTDDDGLEGTSIYASDEEEGDDFKIVNEADEGTETDDDHAEFENRVFWGEPSDEFGEDRVVLKFNGGTGRSVASTLDVRGAVGAHYIGSRNDEDVDLHDGGFPERAGGLIEYDEDRDDGELPRYARDPELRPDVEEREIVVMLQRLSEIREDYDGRAYWATVFVEADEDDEDTVTIGDTEFVELEPTAEFEPSEANLRTQHYLAFDHNYVDIDALNEAREAEGFDEYEPADA